MDAKTAINNGSAQINGTIKSANGNGNSAKNYPGITAPLSTAFPKPEDYEFTRKLEDTLRSYDLFETEEEMTKRIKILSQINLLAKEFVQKVSEQKKIPPEAAAQLNGKVFTFGSFRLGVHTRGADIDTLLVVPRHLERTDFFSTFVELMKEQPNVEYVRTVEEAFVPVLKTKIDDIELDILFARLALKNIPADQELKSIDLLKNLDQKCVRSLNGCRVTDDILSLVPNHESFKLALRAVKYWAKKRCIYSNAMGYLGGVSWAMLVARTCQLYPNALASVVLVKFFYVFSQWNWPKPVLLRNNSEDFENLGFQVWDCRTNLHDRYHLMPIITPSYPQQNSTFNVTLSTRNIIMNEFKLAREICEQVLAGKLEWKDLFEPLNFFGKYIHFIVVVCSNQAEWVGLLESKMRLLVQKLECQPSINTVHLNPNSFENVINESPKTMWFVGLDFDKKKGLNINLTNDISNFICSVKGPASFKNNNDVTVDIRHVRRKDLNMYLSEADLKKVTREKPVKEKNKKKSDDNTISMKRAKIDSNSNGESSSRTETEPNSLEESNNSISNEEATNQNEEEHSNVISDPEIPFLGDSIENATPPIV